MTRRRPTDAQPIVQGKSDNFTIQKSSIAERIEERSDESRSDRRIRIYDDQAGESVCNVHRQQEHKIVKREAIQRLLMGAGSSSTLPDSMSDNKWVMLVLPTCSWFSYALCAMHRRTSVVPLLLDCRSNVVLMQRFANNRIVLLLHLEKVFVFVRLRFDPWKMEGSVTFQTRQKVTPIQNPKMRNQWYKDGAPLQSSNRSHHTSDFGFVRLDIAYTIPEDARICTVVGTNDQREDRTDAQPTVQGRSAIFSDSQNITSWEKIRIMEQPSEKVEVESEAAHGPPHFTNQLS